MSFVDNILWRVADKCVYLTFDDGPDSATTPALLELLAKHGIIATFFVIGKKALQLPDMVAEIHQAGHVLGNHSFNHARLWWKSRSFVARELNRTDETIVGITGKTPVLFRPPYGYFGPNVLRHLQNTGQNMLLWNYSTRDYAAQTTVARIENRINKVRAGRIVLLHDGHENSPRMLAALGHALPKLLDRGLRFKAVQP